MPGGMSFLAQFIAEESKERNLPDGKIDQDALECPICAEEYTRDEERAPKFLACCRKTICGVCEAKIVSEQAHLNAAAIHAVDKKKPPSCPHCRQQLPPTTRDARVDQFLDQKEALEDEAKVEEEELIQCSMCPYQTLKPHHCYVCLGCRKELGVLLLSQRSERRARVKQITMCYSCCFAHLCYHHERGEEVEARPLNLIIGYTPQQVAKATTSLLQKLRTAGYLPHSLCTLLSLQRDLIRDEDRASEATLRTLEEGVAEVRLELVRAKLALLDTGEAESAERAVAERRDVFEFVCSVTRELAGWLFDALCSSKDSAGEEQWTLAAASLLYEVVQLSADILPEALNVAYEHIQKSLLMFFPDILRRWPLDNRFRTGIYDLLFQMCKKSLARSWPDLLHVLEEEAALAADCEETKGFFTEKIMELKVLIQTRDWTE